MTVSNATEHAAAERDLLRLLCSVLVKPVTRVELCRLVDPAKFVEPLQRVLFEEIRALGTIDPKRLLESLPARVTNRGFPISISMTCLPRSWSASRTSSGYFKVPCV